MDHSNVTQLRIVTQWDNFYRYDVFVEKINHSEIKLVGGYSVYILKELQFLLNFSYVLVTEANSYDFGKANEHNADLFVGSFGVFERRAKLADPTFVIGASKVVALINHEFEGGTSFNFLNPLQPSLWFCILLFVIIVLLSSVAIAFATDGFGDGSVPFGDIVFHAFGLVLQKYSTINYSKYVSQLRIIDFAAMLTTLILVTSYIGTMVSFLSVKRYKINSAEALLDSNYNILLERGYNNGSPIQSIAEALTEMPVMQKLLAKAKDSGFVYESFENSVFKALKTPSVYLIDEETAFDTLNGLLSQTPCTLSTVSVLDIKYQWAFYVNKNRKYLKSRLNWGLLRLDQTGLLIRGKRHWIPRHAMCYTRIQKLSKGISLSVKYILWGLIMYGIGISFSFSIFMLEQHFSCEWRLGRGVIRN